MEEIRRNYNSVCILISELPVGVANKMRLQIGIDTCGVRLYNKPWLSTIDNVTLYVTILQMNHDLALLLDTLVP